MTKEIAITKQGDMLGLTSFMIGEYQATLQYIHKLGWVVEYFNKSKRLTTPDNHPDFPTRVNSKSRAVEIVKEVLNCLYAGTSLPSRAPKARPSRPNSKTPKVATAYQVIDRLLNLADDTCTVLVPMGTPARLKTSKVRIVDSEGNTLCEIPHPVFKNLF